MQDDDSANPGMLWVLDGESLWNRKEGSANRSCVDCHGDARASMKGVAARYPALDASRTAYVARQSREQAIVIADDAETRPFITAGSDIFHRRQGQLNLSCAQCHDNNWDQRLAGAPATQAHPTGYPLYRLERQSLGSRLRNCMIGMRAEPYAYGSAEYVDLELYLMWRAGGLAVRP
jgi:sulfur-oxidizing protein SoxA